MSIVSNIFLERLKTFFKFMKNLSQKEIQLWRDSQRDVKFAGFEAGEQVPEPKNVGNL